MPMQVQLTKQILKLNDLLRKFSTCRFYLDLEKSMVQFFSVFYKLNVLTLMCFGPNLIVGYDPPDDRTQCMTKIGPFIMIISF